MSITKRGLIIPNSSQDDILAPYIEIEENGKIVEDYVDTISSMENGQRITGFAYEIDWHQFELKPENFNKVITVLSYIKASATLQYDEEKNETFIVLELNEEQKRELNRLKNLCK